VMAIAESHGLLVIEDAAQGVMSTYRGRPLGSIGALGTLSFHDTKNITAGEGGALFVNDPVFAERAEVIREKGTNRAEFLEGRVDKYTWLDLGSSYLPSEMTAAFLWGQMGAAAEITARRLAIWNTYHRAFERLESSGRLRRPIVPAECQANAHMYYVLLPDGVERSRFLAHLASRGVDAVSHYVPLHSSPAGVRLGRHVGSLAHTTALSSQLVRLPLWLGLEPFQHQVIDAVHAALA
jgi:dTDP-4-amino-4,6-dideoxygalactose transaminase